MTPIYDLDGVTVFHADALDLYDMWNRTAGELLVVDPPWDRTDLVEAAAEAAASYPSALVFTDGRRMGQSVEMFGPPDWLFTWDTRNTWSVSTSHPVQQTKHCLYYGSSYDRDGELWGDPPEAKNHPTTKATPLDGRRLTDLWSESIRWLHNPTAGRAAGGRGNDRHQGPAQHAKPEGWIRCLIGNTTDPDDVVVDPFAGTGTVARACLDTGRRNISIEVDADLAAGIVDRLGQRVLPLALN